MLKNNCFRKETLLNFENSGFSRFFFEGRFFYKSPSMATGRGESVCESRVGLCAPLLFPWAMSKVSGLTGEFFGTNALGIICGHLP